jgi:polysaccharide pyruvyl transferase WcaK-like protein
VKELTRYSNSLFSCVEITVRDSESQSIITELGYVSTLQKDPVFGYTPQRKNLNPEKKTIGLAFRAGFLDDTVVREIVQ